MDDPILRAVTRNAEPPHIERLSDPLERMPRDAVAIILIIILVLAIGLFQVGVLACTCGDLPHSSHPAGWMCRARWRRENEQHSARSRQRHRNG